MVTLTVTPLADLLLSEAAVPSLVGDGLLPEGGSLILYGPAKISKSIALMQLCGALATGTPWLGYQVPRVVSAHYIQVELAESVVVKRTRALLSSIGAGAPIFYSGQRGFVLDSLAAKKELLEAVEKSGAEFVVLDPLSYFLRGSENNDEGVKQLFNALDWVRERHPCSYAFAHHSNKGLWLGTRRVDRGAVDMSGHGWFTRWPDTVGHLTRVAESDMVELRWELVRDGEPPPPRWLRFNKRTLLLEVAGADPATVVLELVRDGPRPAGVVDEVVAERCGISVRKVWGLRKQMVEQGIIREVQNPANKTQKMVERC